MKPPAPMSKGRSWAGRWSSLSLGPPRTAVTWLKLRVNSVKRAARIRIRRLPMRRDLEMNSSLEAVSGFSFCFACGIGSLRFEEKTKNLLAEVESRSKPQT